MDPGPLDHLLTHLRTVTASAGGRTDRELLDRFARDRDEAAFAALVHRHGAMVLGVCRRALGNESDAEDALQATFLVLARKAATGKWNDSIAGWLYNVARRVAATARRRSNRRRAREAQAAVPTPINPETEVSWREVAAVLDEELARLPEVYRLPVLLCCLEGLSRDEAAARLGCPVGTVKARLERARELLRGRLVRRGVPLSVALFGVLLSQSAAPAAVPALVTTAVIRAALGHSAATPAAVALASGAVQATAVVKLKVAATAGLACAVVMASAAGAVGLRSRGGNESPAAVRVGTVEPAPPATGNAPKQPPAGGVVGVQPAPPPVPKRLGRPTLYARFDGFDPGTKLARFVTKKEGAAGGERHDATSNTEFVIDGKSGPVTDIPIGHMVGLYLAKDRGLVTAAAEGSVVRGRRVLAVDPDRRTLILSAPENAQQTYPLDPEAQVTIPGREGGPARELPLTDLQPGAAVTVRLSVDSRRLMSVTLTK